MTLTYTKYYRLPKVDFLSEPWIQGMWDTFDAIDLALYGQSQTTGAEPWGNGVNYVVGNLAIDTTDATTWLCAQLHTSAVSPSTFAQDRAANPSFWTPIMLSLRPRGQWLQNTVYHIGDQVYSTTSGQNAYAICAVNHTSTATGTIQTDAAYWSFTYNSLAPSTAAGIGYDHTASALVATNVQAAIDEVVTKKAPLISPAFTGVPTAPTVAPATDNSTKLATTAFVQGVAAGLAISYAPLNSPAFTGAPTAPTPIPATDNSTRIATTAFVQGAMVAVSPGVLSWNGRTGMVTLAPSDVAGAGGAPLASPAFTGTPTAPLAPINDNTGALATTAFFYQQSSIGLPSMDGVAAAGVGTKWARGDHVHPSDTSRLAKAGDTMTGQLTLSYPSPFLMINAPASGQGRGIWGNTNSVVRWKMFLGTGAPESGANSGSDFAINCFDDAGAVINTPLTIARATALATLSGDPVAPLGVATKQYVDNAGASHNVGRNFLHNPMFNIQQRNLGPWTVSGNTADRWKAVVTNDTDSFQILADVDSDRSFIGDESAQWQLRNTFTGTAAANSLSFLSQSVENVMRLANKTVTVSFWAWGTAGLKFGVCVDQLFGSGGSPSAAVLGNGQTITITGVPTRYSLTFVLPSAAGKTLGTNNDHSTSLGFWYSAGSNYNARSGNVGVQSGTVSIWGMQLEIGSVATPLEHIDPGLDLANCQRFFQNGFAGMYGYTVAGGGLGGVVTFSTTMRAVPAVAFLSPAYGNCSGITAASVSTVSMFAYATGTTTGYTTFSSTFTASADL